MRDLERERQQRDMTLDLFEQHRPVLVEEARRAAIQIAKQNGTVTSPEVIEILEARFPAEMAAVDPRFMGAVFRGQFWERIGFANQGSHCRPVSVWRLKAA